MKTKIQYPKTPTLDRMIENQEELQAIGAFLEDLQQKNISKCLHKQDCELHALTLETKTVHFDIPIIG